MNIKYNKCFFEHIEKAIDRWVDRMTGTTLNSGGSLIKSKVLGEVSWTLYNKNQENPKRLTLHYNTSTESNSLVIGEDVGRRIMRFKVHDISRYSPNETVNNWGADELKSLCDFVERTIAQYGDYIEEYDSDKETEEQNKKQEAINALNEKIAKLNSTRSLFQDKVEKLKEDFSNNIGSLEREISDLEFELATAKMELRITEDKDYLNYI